VVINTVDETRIINAKGNSVPSSILTKLKVGVRILNDETNYDFFYTNRYCATYRK
jgi:hypothetical protein